jgi:hypothetical protein
MCTSSFSSRYEKEPDDTGSERKLGVASACLSGLDELRGFGCCLFEGQAIEAPNVASRPRQEFVTRSAVRFEVGFVIYRFLSLGVIKVKAAVLRVGEIVLSNPHVLRAENGSRRCRRPCSFTDTRRRNWTQFDSHAPARFRKPIFSHTVAYKTLWLSNCFSE